MPRISHVYRFPATTVPRIAARLLAAVLLLAVLLHTAARFGWLPDPAPADLDHTILSAKVELATRPGNDARIVLLGDSSCLMNVDARALADHLGRPVLNLGTLSYLDLASHADLYRRYEETRERPPDLVVLLMNPASLRRAEAAPGYREWLREELARRDLPSRPPPGLVWTDWTSWFGANLLRDRLAHRGMPPLLRGPFAPAYGTTRAVARRLLEERGSLRDPSRWDPRSSAGSAEYRLALGLEEAAREFRRRLSPRVPLVVGFTPVPVSLVSPAHSENLAALRSTWIAWLGNVPALAGLPEVLPDDRFATPSHLTPVAVPEFTRALAEAIRTAAAPGP